MRRFIKDEDWCFLAGVGGRGWGRGWRGGAQNDLSDFEHSTHSDYFKITENYAYFITSHIIFPYLHLKAVFHEI